MMKEARAIERSTTSVIVLTFASGTMGSSSESTRRTLGASEVGRGFDVRTT
jgi:hypothetical protein